MKYRVIAFTARGAGLAARLASQLEGAEAFAMAKYAAGAGVRPVEKLSRWAQEAWQEAEGLIFVGATGIAVRTIAPLLQKKTVDPAVVVMDEAGRYAISLTSGHIGGANELAQLVAHLVGAEPVITTATDVNGKFAVDVFARKNGLVLTSLPAAKEVSASILSGQPVGLFSEFPMDGPIPPELTPWTRQSWNVEIALRPRWQRSLWLAPVCIDLGIGCKKNTPAERIAAAVDAVLREYGVSLHSVAGVASIDLKQNEPGLLEYLKQTGLEAVFYTAAQLNELPGTFSRSGFVNKITGVDCVCERAAVRRGGGTLLAPKHAFDGVTVALARREMRIQF